MPRDKRVVSRTARNWVVQGGVEGLRDMSHVDNSHVKINDTLGTLGLRSNPGTDRLEYHWSGPGLVTH